MKVEIYSDIVCPWCYIGERRFGRALSAFSGAEEVEVVFRPYQLDPDAPAAAVPLKEYLEKRFGRRIDGLQEHVGGIAEAEGISIAWDRALAANTRNAHRLLRLAERDYGSEVQHALAERFFDLHFTRGGNIADLDQLAGEAVAVGMDRGRVQSYLASDEGAGELEAEFQRARDLGISAVPTFVFDGRVAVQGAQSTEKFLETLFEVAGAGREADEGGEGACGSDGCAI